MSGRICLEQEREILKWSDEFADKQVIKKTIKRGNKEKGGEGEGGGEAVTRNKGSKKWM